MRRFTVPFLVMLAWSSSSGANPFVPRDPDLSLESTAGHTRRLGQYAGRIVVLMYEDRHSTHQNDALKADLVHRARTSGLARQVALLPIANVQGLRFWPVEGFVRSTVNDAAHRYGIEILIDWTGSVGRAFRFPSGMSNVAIVGRGGTVLYRHTGTLSPLQRAQFFQILAGELSADRS